MQTESVTWHKPQDGLFKILNHTRVQAGVALTLMVLQAAFTLVYAYSFVTEVNRANITLIDYPQRVMGVSQTNYSLSNLRSIDVMKYTKDVMRNQPSDAEIENLVATLADTLHPTHIAISIPLDSSDAYPNAKPSPRTAAAFTQKWADAIHAHGIKIIWRGTWSGIEGIYDFSKLDGAKRFPAGTAASAATDGNSTWLGKTYQYITANPTFFADGDIWAVMPERTEGIFKSTTSFLPYTGAGIQANYAAFFNDLKTISDSAFGVIHKNILTGWTANNFTEVKSGWLDESVFATAGIISIDHYGSSHTVAEMEKDLRGIYAQHHKQIFLQEWGDYWNINLPESQRLTYLNDMYAMLQRLSNEGILAGFNYWGGWINSGEGILAKTNDQFQINNRGNVLARLFDANKPGAAAPTPLPTPAPTPIPTPTPAVTPPANSQTGNSTQSAANAAQYANQSIVNDQGTLYLILGRTKIPFANFEAFVKLGYASRPVVNGETGGYAAPTSYLINKSDQQHPWGSWILYGRTIYYSHESGLIGVPSFDIFTSNGGRADLLVPANAADIAAISKQLLEKNDQRVLR